MRVSDYAQRKEVIERERAIARRDQEKRRNDGARRDRAKRSGDLADIDIAEQPIEHDAGRRDEDKAENKSDAIPARCPASDPRNRWGKLHSKSV